MPQASYQQETVTLHSIVADPQCRWWWTTHALERMAQRDVNAEDINRALTTGHVVLIETNKKDVLWRVVGRDTDGRKVEVVVAVYEDEIRVKVVTVF